MDVCFNVVISFHFVVFCVYIAAFYGYCWGEKAVLWVINGFVQTGEHTEKNRF